MLHEDNTKTGKTDKLVNLGTDFVFNSEMESVLGDRVPVLRVTRDFEA